MLLPRSENEIMRESNGGGNQSKTDRETKKEMNERNSRNMYEKRKDYRGNENINTREEEVEEMGAGFGPFLLHLEDLVRNREQ